MPHGSHCESAVNGKPGRSAATGSQSAGCCCWHLAIEQQRPATRRALEHVAALRCYPQLPQSRLICRPADRDLRNGFCACPSPASATTWRIRAGSFNCPKGTSNNTGFRRFLSSLSERLPRACRGESPIGDFFTPSRRPRRPLHDAAQTPPVRALKRAQLPSARAGPAAGCCNRGSSSRS